MATSVNAAFAEFLANSVNLDPDVTAQARASRDWLVAQLHGFPLSDTTFPLSFEAQDVFFGSFHRRTKIRELDDIDLIACLSAEGSKYWSDPGRIRIRVPDNTRLRSLCHDDTDELNSRKVINRFIRGLETVPQYKNSGTRNGEAVVLELESRPWSFDIVPGFFTEPEADGRTYYLIPDGNGHWKKTDPRIDQERITSINAAHQGNVLHPIRLIKFWNRRPVAPAIPPYVLECMVLDHYQTATASKWPDLEVAPVLLTIATAVLGPVHDPKGIQGDLNQLSFADRLSIYRRANQDAVAAVEAREAERRGDHRAAIVLWGQIFGSDFPQYG
jgi:hypothetical protein